MMNNFILTGNSPPLTIISDDNINSIINRINNIFKIHDRIKNVAWKYIKFLKSESDIQKYTEKNTDFLSFQFKNKEIQIFCKTAIIKNKVEFESCSYVNWKAVSKLIILKIINEIKTTFKNTLSYNLINNIWKQ